jgi:catechol 2,3-dioxygenase-like lactoylglutathione lyase family enzyme
MRGLRHLALQVRDVSRSRAFYEHLFGMHVVWQPDPEHVHLSSGPDNLALHQKPAECQDSPDRRFCAMDHFGFLVESPQAVDRMFEWVERNGVRIVHPPRHHRDGSYSFYLADPDDNVIQILYEPTISRLEFVPSDTKSSASRL